MLDIPLRYDSENMSSLVVARCRFLLYKNLMLEKSYLAIVNRSKTSANIVA